MASDCASGVSGEGVFAVGEGGAVVVAGGAAVVVGAGTVVAVGAPPVLLEPPPQPATAATASASTTGAKYLTMDASLLRHPDGLLNEERANPPHWVRPDLLVLDALAASEPSTLVPSPEPPPHRGPR